MEITACKYCESSKIDNSKFKNYFLCRSCGSLCSKINFTTEELRDHYHTYYNSENLDTPEFVRSRLLDRLTAFEKYRSPTNSLLDIGFGAGDMLTAAASLNWKVFGTEISESAVKNAKIKNLEVKHGEFEPSFFKTKFDVICLIETIEHLVDPKSIIKKMCTSLRPGGLVFGTTPNASSLNRRILGENWSALGVPEHLNVATKLGLKKAFLGGGFSSASIWSSGFNPYDLMQYLPGILRGKVESDFEVGRVAFGYKINEVTSKSFVLASFRSVLQKALRLTNSGDSLIFMVEK